MGLLQDMTVEDSDVKCMDEMSSPGMALLGRSHVRLGSSWGLLTGFNASLNKVKVIFGVLINIKTFHMGRDIAHNTYEYDT